VDARGSHLKLEGAAYNCADFRLVARMLCCTTLCVAHEGCALRSCMAWTFAMHPVCRCKDTSGWQPSRFLIDDGLPLDAPLQTDLPVGQLAGARHTSYRHSYKSELRGVLLLALIAGFLGSVLTDPCPY